MSAGNFTSAVYRADYNTTTVQFHPIRVQPETLLAEAQGTVNVQNASAVGTINNPISAVCSIGDRGRGLKPRTVNLRIGGTPPTGYSATSRTTIPALTPEFYEACLPGVDVDYLGTTWVVVGRSPESAD